MGGTVPEIESKEDYTPDKWIGENGMDYGDITASSVFTKSFVFVPRYTPNMQYDNVGQTKYTINYTVETSGYTIVQNGGTAYSHDLYYGDEIGILTPNPGDNTYFRYYINEQEFVSTATIADIEATLGYGSFPDKIINITLVVDTL